MKEYEASFSITFTVEAGNEDKAHERAEAIMEELLAGKIGKHKWFGENLDYNEDSLEEV